MSLQQLELGHIPAHTLIFQHLAFVRHNHTIGPLHPGSGLVLRSILLLNHTDRGLSAKSLQISRKFNPIAEQRHLQHIATQQVARVRASKAAVGFIGEGQHAIRGIADYHLQLIFDNSTITGFAGPQCFCTLRNQFFQQRRVRLDLFKQARILNGHGGFRSQNRQPFLMHIGIQVRRLAQYGDKTDDVVLPLDRHPKIPMHGLIHIQKNPARVVMNIANPNGTASLRHFSKIRELLSLQRQHLRLEAAESVIPPAADDPRHPILRQPDIRAIMGHNPFNVFKQHVQHGIKLDELAQHNGGITQRLSPHALVTLRQQQRAILGNIATHSHQPGNVALTIAQGDFTREQPALFTRRCEIIFFQIQQRLTGFQQNTLRLGEGFRYIRRIKIKVRFAQQIGRRASSHHFGYSIVGGQKTSFGILHIDQIRQRIDQHPQKIAVTRKLRCQLFTLGDIPQKGRQQWFFQPVQGGNTDFNVYHVTILMPVPGLKAPVPLLQHTLNRLQDLIRGLNDLEISNPHAQQLMP